MLQCTACGNFDCFTSDGVPLVWLNLGFLKCTVCGRIVKPRILELAVVEETTES